MKTLNEWKYEIVFNNERYIDANEKRVMDMQLDFYRNHYSFDQLIHKLRASSERGQSILLLVASKHVKNILYTPYQLKQYYLKIINTEFSKYKQTLTTLLNESMAASGRNNLRKIYKAVLHQYMPTVKRKIAKYAKRKLQFVPFNQKLTQFDYLHEIVNMQNHMIEDKLGQGIFGKYTLYNTQFNYNNLLGLGEYQFNKMHHDIKDVFILNSNADNLTIHKLRHLTYLNLYPGKGHLLNTLYSPARANCLDLGGTYLINGWSLFAMWHYNQNAYTRNLKVICGNLGKAFLGSSLAKGANRAYNYMLGLMPKDEALQYLIYITQYPGYLESYIFGAIAVEECINRGFASSPADLLNTLKLVNIGDYLFEYTKGYKKSLGK